MTPQPQTLPNLARRWDGVVALLALAVIAGLFVAAPGTLLDKTDRAAYAVCHRFAGHSFLIAGRQLPLCARCSGTYLGALAGLAVMIARGRGRAGRLPGRRYLAVLGVFVAAWAFDGANSYLTLFPGAPYLYEPRNLLRLLTGALEGLALAAVLLPIMNLAFWPAPEPVPSIGNWRDLAWLLAAAALVVVAVNSEVAPLLYPLALLSSLAVVLLVGAVNAIGVVTVSRRGGKFTSWRPLLAPCLAGLAIGMSELAAIGLLRAELTTMLGLPF